MEVWPEHTCAGLEELAKAGLGDIQVVACCDLVEAQAQQRADEIAEFQAHKPAIYTDVERMLTHVEDLDTVDICALHSQHHILAVACLEAGKHVIIEKPLAITLRAGRKILNAAVDNRCQLAVAENYRRSPQERARSWAVASGRIGQPRTFYWQEAGLRLGKWGWRNFKRDAGAGWILDGGVHFADLFRYHLGTEARQVVARVHGFEPYRYDEPVEREGAWPVDVEDCAMALIDFDGGAVVQWTWQGSAPGQDFSKRVLYGSEGCIDWGERAVDAHRREHIHRVIGRGVSEQPRRGRARAAVPQGSGKSHFNRTQRLRRCRAGTRCARSGWLGRLSLTGDLHGDL